MSNRAPDESELPPNSKRAKVYKYIITESRAEESVPCVDWSLLLPELWKQICLFLHPWYLARVSNSIRSVIRRASSLWAEDERFSTYHRYCLENYNTLYPDMPVGAYRDYYTFVLDEVIIPTTFIRLVNQDLFDAELVTEWLCWARRYCYKFTKLPTSPHADDSKMALQYRVLYDNLYHHAPRVLQAFARAGNCDSIYDLLFEPGLVLTPAFPPIRRLPRSEIKDVDMKRLILEVAHQPTLLESTVWNLCGLLTISGDAAALPSYRTDYNDANCALLRDPGHLLFHGRLSDVLETTHTLYAKSYISYQTYVRIYESVAKWAGGITSYDSLIAASPYLYGGSEIPTRARKLASLMVVSLDLDRTARLAARMFRMIAAVEPTSCWPLCTAVAVTAIMSDLPRHDATYKTTLWRRLNSPRGLGDLRDWLSKPQLMLSPRNSPVSSLPSLATAIVVAIGSLPIPALPHAFFGYFADLHGRRDAAGLQHVAYHSSQLRLTDDRFMELLLYAAQSEDATEAMCHWEFAETGPLPRVVNIFRARAKGNNNSPRIGRMCSYLPRAVSPNTHRASEALIVQNRILRIINAIPAAKEALGSIYSTHSWHSLLGRPKAVGRAKKAKKVLPVQTAVLPNPPPPPPPVPPTILPPPVRTHRTEDDLEDLYDWTWTDDD